MTPDAMATLHAASFTTPRPWSSAEIAALLGGPGVFVCTESSGFAMGRVAAGEAEVLTLAVAPAARRQGSGARLLATLLAEARQRGATRAFLEVAADNSAAIALYLQVGFAVCGRRRSYYRPAAAPAVDALVMDRPI